MTAQILQVGSKMIQADEMLSLLQRYQLMSQVLRGLVIDQAIADIICTQEERLAAIAQFETHYQITSSEARSAWLQNQGMTLEQMQDLAIRPVKIEKFKTATWEPKVGSYFLACKTSFDRVVYSLIRTKDKGTALEVYFRIKEGEQSFGELAQQYSQGAEADTGGGVGPVPLSQPHPAIAKILSISQPGQLWHPLRLEEWFIVLRLEKLFPARLDEQMRRHLIDQLFETWLDEQIKTVEPFPRQGSLAA